MNIQYDEIKRERIGIMLNRYYVIVTFGKINQEIFLEKRQPYCLFVLSQTDENHKHLKHKLKINLLILSIKDPILFDNTASYYIHQLRQLR